MPVSRIFTCLDWLHCLCQVIDCSHLVSVVRHHIVPKRLQQQQQVPLADMWDILKASHLSPRFWKPYRRLLVIEYGLELLSMCLTLQRSNLAKRLMKCWRKWLTLLDLGFPGFCWWRWRSSLDVGWTIAKIEPKVKPSKLTWATIDCAKIGG